MLLPDTTHKVINIYHCLLVHIKKKYILNSYSIFSSKYKYTTVKSL